MRLRGLFVVAAVFPAALGVTAQTSAQSLTRPYDAPVVTNARATTPAKPPAYREALEQGLSFVYHPAAHERVRAVMPSMVRARDRLRAQLGRDVLSTLEIRIAAIPEEMRTLGPLEDISPYAPAIAFSKQRLILTSLGSSRSLEPTDLSTTLTHALAHLALDEVLEDHAVPVWFHEGYAASMAGDGRSMRAEAMVMAAMQQRLLGIAEMHARFPADAPESSAAYAHAADFLTYLSDKPRQKSFANLLERTRNGEHFDSALPAAYGMTTSKVEEGWRASMARRYGFLPVFLGAMAIWAVIAIAIWARKFWLERKGRQEKPLRDDARIEPQPERISIIDMVVARAERLPARGRGESTGATIPLEAEVPKVEHEGDWHTLH